MSSNKFAECAPKRLDQDQEGRVSLHSTPSRRNTPHVPQPPRNGRYAACLNVLAKTVQCIVGKCAPSARIKMSSDRHFALQQSSRLGHLRAMSALPPKADIGTQPRDVRFVPKADILRCGTERRYSITSSAVASSSGGMLRPNAVAVLRLITNSNLADSTTGRSAGF